MPIASPIALRFWPKVEKTPTCWLWTAGAGDHGYGTIERGRKLGKKTLLAHVVSYEMENGPVPDGLELDHLCRVRRCVNPAHLEAVTHKVNALRGMSPNAINARKEFCHRGHSLSGINLYITPRGTRNCKTCRRDWMRDYHQRAAAALRAKESQ